MAIIETAVASGIGVMIGAVLVQIKDKILKKDCSECASIQMLQHEIDTLKKIMLRVAVKVGAEVKEYEELV